MLSTCHPRVSRRDSTWNGPFDAAGEVPPGAEHEADERADQEPAPRATEPEDRDQGDRPELGHHGEPERGAAELLPILAEQRERPRGEGDRDEIEPQVDEAEQRQPDQQVRRRDPAPPPPGHRRGRREVGDEREDRDPCDGAADRATREHPVDRRLDRHELDREVPVGDRGRGGDPEGAPDIGVHRADRGGPQDDHGEDDDADPDQRPHQAGGRTLQEAGPLGWGVRHLGLNRSLPRGR